MSNHERVGVLSPGATGGGRLVAEVIAAELATRIPGAEVVVVGPGDEAAWPGVVVVDDRLPDGAPRLHPEGRVVVPLTDVAAEQRPPVATLLADRLFGAGVLAARAAQLRLAGTLSHAGPILLTAVGAGMAADVAGDLARLAYDQRLALVVAAPDGGLRLLAPAGSTDDSPSGPPTGPGPGEPLDLAAACSVAGVVVTDDPATAGLALALGCPTIGLATGPAGAWPAGAAVVDVVARVAAALGPARARAADPAERQPARDRLDAALDAVASTLREVLADRPPPPPAAPADVAHRLADLERAHAGLLRRVTAERKAFGQVAASLLEPAGDDDRQRLWVKLLQAEDAEAAAMARAEEAADLAQRLEASITVLGATVGRQEVEITRLRRRADDADRLGVELDEARAETAGLRDAEAQLASLRSSRLYPLRRVVARARAVLRTQAS